MNNDTQANLELIESYVENGSEEAYVDLIAGRTNMVIVVDWREHDEDIIQYCEDILNSKQLRAKTVDADNTQGFELTIEYKEQQLKVAYPADGSDRDSTMIHLNQILQPDYEIRFCEASMGSDILEFLPLSKNNWDKLERKMGRDNVAACFAKITADSCFFG